MKTIAALSFALLAAAELSAATIYVDNVKGNDSNDGSKERPVASIEKGLTLLKRSGRLEVAPNNGKPYRRPYPGVNGKSLDVKVGGTPEQPLVLNGNGAVISGLSAVPADRWEKAGDGVYALPFWPMSNLYKHYHKQDYWLPASRIFFVDGEPAVNCLSHAEMEKTPGSFWWSRKERKLFFKLPAGKPLESLTVELPANAGFYVLADHVRIENFTVILSWNDGFDAAGDPRGVLYRNCVAIDNCGQGFSCHGSSIVLYEDCVAVRCASSGSCDVHWSNSSYARCVFLNNIFEGAVAANDNSAHTYSSCLVVHNEPFEQIWQNNYSRMFFDNCVIIGNGGTIPLMFLRHGSASFRQCTLLNAGILNRGEADNRGTLTIEHSLIGNMGTALMDIPAGMEKRVMLSGNLYFGSKGFRVAGKLLSPGENPGRFDVNSRWYDGKLSGRLESELPQPVRQKNASGEMRRVGAALPESVWKNYEKYRKVKTSPAGVTFLPQQKNN